MPERKMNSPYIRLFDELVVFLSALKTDLESTVPEDSIFYSDHAVLKILEFSFEDVNKKCLAVVKAQLASKIKHLSVSIQIETLDKIIKYLEESRNVRFNTLSQISIVVSSTMSPEEVKKMEDSAFTEVCKDERSSFFGPAIRVNIIREIHHKLCFDLQKFEGSTFDELKEFVNRLSIGFLEIPYIRSIKSDIIKFFEGKEMDTAIFTLIAMLRFSVDPREDVVRGTFKRRHTPEQRNFFEIRIIQEIFVGDGFIESMILPEV